MSIGLIEMIFIRHVDTSLVDIDVQPTYIRALVKGRLLQLVLPAEVQTDQSVAQRSMATGHLVITMPTVIKYSYYLSSIQLSLFRQQYNLLLNFQLYFTSCYKKRVCGILKQYICPLAVVFCFSRTANGSV